MMLPSPSTPQRPLSHSPPFTRPLPTSARAAKAFARVVALQQRVQHYRDLGGFVVLMALFITILYLQADSSISHEITSAHAVLYPPVCASPYPTPCPSPPYAPPLPHSVLPPPRVLPHIPHIPTASFASLTRLSHTHRPVCSSLPAALPAAPAETVGGPDVWLWHMRPALPVPGVWPLWLRSGLRHLPQPHLRRHPALLSARHTAGSRRIFLEPLHGQPGLPLLVCSPSSRRSALLAVPILCTHPTPPHATPCVAAMRCGAIRYEEFQPFRVGDAEVSVALNIPDGDWVVVLNAPAGRGHPRHRARTPSRHAPLLHRRRRLHH
ncbi:unnamed protein product [Closterium sp. NIES-53]